MNKRVSKPVAVAQPTFVSFTLEGGQLQKVRPELIGGITFNASSAEVVLTNYQTAFRVSPEEGHRLAEVLEGFCSAPVVLPGKGHAH